MFSEFEAMSVKVEKEWSMEGQYQSSHTYMESKFHSWQKEKNIAQNKNNHKERNGNKQYKLPGLST